MAATFRWTVEFSDLRGRNLGGAASSSPSAPYLKLNLDNFYEGTTTAAKRGAAPTWEVPAGGECVRYETRHAARLGDKQLVVEVWDKTLLGAHRLVGEGRVDLLTLFTGPRDVEVSVSDKSHAPRGVVCLAVRASQECAPTAVVRNLVFELDDAAAAESGDRDRDSVAAR